VPDWHWEPVTDDLLDGLPPAVLAAVSQVLVCGLHRLPVEPFLRIPRRHHPDVLTTMLPVLVNRNRSMPTMAATGCQLQNVTAFRPISACPRPVA
jgi:hypothetical protein